MVGNPVTPKSIRIPEPLRASSLPHPQASDHDILRRSRVLVVGAGGLGAPAAACLTSAGVGTIGIVDPDRVELSNLHRQLLHRTADLGRFKVASARDRLRAVNAEVTVETFRERLDGSNAASLIGRFHFTIDGSDNFATKFLVNDVAVAQRKPFSHGGVLGFLGQTMTVLPGRTACYRCLFSAPPPQGETASCQDAGILGPVAGVVGMIQAAQAIAFLLERDELLLNVLLTYDALRTRWRTVHVRPNPSCAACATLPSARPLGSE